MYIQFVIYIVDNVYSTLNDLLASSIVTQNQPKSALVLAIKLQTWPQPSTKITNSAVYSLFWLLALWNVLKSGLNRYESH